MGISKDDVKAMRQADRVCFRIIRDGKATVELIKERREKDTVYFGGPHELRRDIEVDGYISSDYRKAFAMLFCANSYGAWDAVTKLVREGDELRIAASENGNDYVRAAMIPAGALSDEHHPGGYSSIHADAMYLSVRRNGKDLVRNVLMYECICPDNSARMLQV